MLGIWADPDVWPALRPDAPGAADLRFAAERFEHHIRHWEEHGFGYWLAEERESGDVAGWFGAAHPSYIPELAKVVEVGWTLSRAFWGRGLATEGGAAAVNACLNHLPQGEVVALIHPGNARSIAVAARLGMSAEGRAYHSSIIDGDVRVYRLRAPDAR